MRRVSPAVAASLAAAGVVWALPFFVATTFIGDDHVFLAFARHAPNPLVAFVRDQHGGEFYRPLPMLLWWILGRAGGGASAPFAALALVLHAAAAGLVGALVAALGRGRRATLVAAALFALAPQNLEAAYWYAASTDLLATTFALASLVTLARRRDAASVALAFAAYLSKEAALILPALALVALGAAPTPDAWRRRLARVAPHAALAGLVILVRWHVLGGWGGSGDPVAPLPGRLLQLVSGLVHVGTGDAFVPGPLAWGAGACALGLLGLAAFRAARAGTGAASAPLVFTLVSLAPLLAAGWVVGARYFYLPAVGLAWAAGEALAARPRAVALTLGATLFAIGGVQAAGRRAEVVAYEARVSAARRAVSEGAARGARVFHVAGAVKDLDLAVKEDPALAPLADDLLILADVPASFVLMPSALATRAATLVAAPPLPPSGAYQFGARRVVGLARRGDEATLDEVLALFPDLRFVRLRPTPGGHVIARDVTEELKSAD